MITLKYEKKLSAVYVSHIDLLRNMARIIRRTKYLPDFSQGFNPHMLLFFSPPLAVGIASECEYVSIDIKNVESDAFLNAFNEVVPEGIKATKSFYTEKSPNLAGKIVEADYLFPSNDVEMNVRISEDILSAKTYDIEYLQKKQCVQKDVRQLIKGVDVCDDGLVFRLSTGNENLRADRLLSALKKNNGLNTKVNEIVKINQFVLNDGQSVEADLFLRGTNEKSID